MRIKSRLSLFGLFDGVYDVTLHAVDWSDAYFFAGLFEKNVATHFTVVSEANGRSVNLLDSIGDLLDGSIPVKKGEFAVCVK